MKLPPQRFFVRIVGNKLEFGENSISVTGTMIRTYGLNRTSQTYGRLILRASDLHESDPEA